MSITKVCGDCRQRKPSTDYHRSRVNSKGLGHYCKDCERVRVRFSHFQRTYGLTGEDHAALLAAQDGRCALCGLPDAEVMRNGQPSALTVDHDHVTGEIRGLLCPSCNIWLCHYETPGLAQRLARAPGYLATPPGRDVLPDTAFYRPEATQPVRRGRTKKAARAYGLTQLDLADLLE